MTDKILIFRRGSLGDGSVSIPALCWLVEAYPNAERRILTNTPVMEKAAGLEELLGTSDIVDGFHTFPPGVKGISRWRTVRKAIKAWGPNHLVYLSEPSGAMGLIREYLFFRWCGIRRFTGFPARKAVRRYAKIEDRLWESEAGRLLRAVGGESANARIWRITFTEEEKQTAADHLDNWPARGNPGHRFIAFSIGGKFPDKDWGDTNWRTLLTQLSEATPNVGLIAIGAENEKERSASLLTHWSGPTLNLCGLTAPRVSALVMEPAEFYLGHDSGPMHLAALVGTPCIAVFSARAKPGVWFPQGDRNRIFYPWDESDGAPEAAGLSRIGATIGKIDVAPVVTACKEMLINDPVAG